MGHVSGARLAEQAGIARISNASNLGSRFRHDTRLTALDERAPFSGRVTAIRAAWHCLRIAGRHRAERLVRMRDLWAPWWIVGCAPKVRFAPDSLLEEAG